MYPILPVLMVYAVLSAVVETRPGHVWLRAS